MPTYYPPEARHEIVTALTGFLADSAVVYFKTHSFHWNVEGNNFYSNHKMFEEFYKEIWESLDVIAERIRVFGEKVSPNYAEMLEKATIDEVEASPSSNTMIQNLRDDYIRLSKEAHSVGAIAEKHGDPVTVDLMTQRSAFLEKAAWMLQSSVS